MKSPLLEALQDRVLVFDGAMGTQLQASNLTAQDFALLDRKDLPKQLLQAAAPAAEHVLEGCNELLNLTRPDVVEAIHAGYLQAGADIVETNTFGATSIVLAEYGLQNLVYEIAHAAGKIARKAADKAATPANPKFVAGALGPGTRLVSLGQTTWAELVKTYSEAFKGLIEAGVDALLLETLQDLLMVKAGVVAANQAMAETQRQVPLIVQVTMEQTGTMLLGSELAAAVNMLEAFPSVQVVGMNCATGPVEMAPHVRFLGQSSTRPLSIQPNAGLPVMEKGVAHYKLTPSQFAEHHTRFVKDHGAALVGGCCGTTPDHIRAVVQAVGGKKHSADCLWRKSQNLFPGFDFSLKTPDHDRAVALVGCSSLYQFQPYTQDASILIVGEKTNANGSKAFRDMLAKENWEGLTELARELEAEGSHVLDVCTAYVGRDEERDMRTLLAHYNRHITVPLMIDSTEINVVEAALQCVAGKPIINSINYEDGGARVEKVLELCRKYGAAVVALTIDESGMAKTCDQKLQIAERLLRATRESGLPDHDVFIDCLTFTLGSGDEEFRKSALETANAIRALRERHPRVNAILGVSNVSFGLKPAARQVLNSAFLHVCREVGLNSAIVHFSKIRPENQIDPGIWKVATDLLFDRREFAVA